MAGECGAWIQVVRGPFFLYNKARHNLGRERERELVAWEQGAACEHSHRMGTATQCKTRETLGYNGWGYYPLPKPLCKPLQ